MLDPGLVTVFPPPSFPRRPPPLSWDGDRFVSIYRPTQSVCAFFLVMMKASSRSVTFRPFVGKQDICNHSCGIGGIVVDLVEMVLFAHARIIARTLDASNFCLTPTLDASKVDVTTVLFGVVLMEVRREVCISPLGREIVRYLPLLANFPILVNGNVLAAPTLEKARVLGAFELARIDRSVNTVNSVQLT